MRGGRIGNYKSIQFPYYNRQISMHSFTLLYLPEYLNITTTVHTYDGMEINAHFQYQVGTMHSLAASAAHIGRMGRSRASKGFGSNSTQFNAAPPTILFTICDGTRSYYTSEYCILISTRCIMILYHAVK